MLSEKDIKDLLRKLAEGRASDQERALLREHTQNDPFLEEALDGFNLLPGQHDKELREIEDRLETRSSLKITAPKNSASRWQMAAAIALLLAVSGWMIRGSLSTSTQHAAEEQLAFQHPTLSQADKTDPASSSDAGDLLLLAESKETKEETVVSADSQAEPDDSDIETGISAQAAIAANESTEARRELEEETRTAVESEGISSQSTIDDSPTSLKESTDAISQTGAIAKRPNADVAAALAAPLPTPSSFYVGQVVDQSGEPLIGANIRSLRTSIGQVSDLDGHFRIKQEELEEGIEVSYVGFKSQTINAEASGENEVVVLIENSTSLNVVAVVNRPVGKSKIAKESRSSTRGNEPRPRGGFATYQAYITQNMKMPQAAIEANVHGSVVLSFSIGKNERATDLQIESSLGYGCDQEAMRLVENGPKWEGKSDERIRLEVKF